MHEPLDEKLLVEAVHRGIDEANDELGTSYSVSHIRYCENDTTPEEVYRGLALALLRHLHMGGEFTEVAAVPPM